MASEGNWCFGKWGLLGTVERAGILHGGEVVGSWDNRWARAFFTPGMETGWSSAWCPAVDIVRATDAWIVKLELAGVDPDEVDVRVEAGRLRISGQRRDELDVEDAVYEQLEIAYAPFVREVPLADLPANPRVSMECRNGILIIVVEAAYDVGIRS